MDPELKYTRPSLGSHIRRIGLPFLAVAFVFLCTLVLQALAVGLVSRYAPHLADAKWYPWVISMVPMYAVAMPLSLLIYRAVPAQPPKKHSISLPVWLGLLAICFALTYLGNWMGILVNAVISAVTGQPTVNDLANLASDSPLWANLLFGGILAPIMEEIFYRKMMIDRLSVYGDLPAILISGLVFGLIHGNFSQFFYAAIIGVVLGYVYIKTGKIRYTVALHMAINLVGSVYSVEMIKKLDPELLASNPLRAMIRNFGGIAMYASYGVFMLAVLISAPIALILLRKYIHLRRAASPLSAAEWSRVLLLNPGTWVLALVVGLLFLA
ncbi:MAG: CPBP family intramembrane metalloprotease [Clostridia bacterium]|nr:CPBP family intramembrane metalloprotease [Clostridia bacterium]